MLEITELTVWCLKNKTITYAVPGGDILLHHIHVKIT